MSVVPSLLRKSRAIAFTAPLLSRLKFSGPVSGWSEVFAELSVLTRLERLETSASAAKDHWGSLRGLTRLKYLGLSGSCCSTDIDRVLHDDLLFVTLYSQEEFLLFHEDAQTLGRLLDLYQNRGMCFTRAAAFKAAAAYNSNHEVLQHPHLLAALSLDEPIPAQFYVDAFAVSDDFSVPLRALFAPYFKDKTDEGCISITALPSSLFNALRSWLGKKHQEVFYREYYPPILESQLLKMIPELMSSAERLSWLIHTERLQDAVGFIRAEVSKGQKVAENLVLELMDHSIYEEPLVRMMKGVRVPVRCQSEILGSNVPRSLRIQS